jgi:thiol-disulfide isomerase/thioredoxin
MTDSGHFRQFTGTAKELTNAIVGHRDLVVVVFGARWCPPCIKVDESLPTLAAQNPKVLFLKIDIEESRDLQIDYQVNAIPQLKFFRPGPQGKVQDLASVTGADMTQIKAKLSQFA